MEWTEEQLQFLDNLRDSGVTSMFGAVPYIQGVFGLTRKEVWELLVYWMDTYAARHEEES